MKRAILYPWQVIAILLVFIVLLFEFGGFAAPIAILASAILSTSGVFIALLITGTTFNVSSFMGMIMVIGIVPPRMESYCSDADQKLRAHGLSAEDSMLQASRRRLRPIVMTALATIAGMLPLAFAFGAGSQMLQPLAIAVIGGVIISMVLSLIVTPSIKFFLSPDLRQQRQVHQNCRLNFIGREYPTSSRADYRLSAPTAQLNSGLQKGKSENIFTL